MVDTILLNPMPLISSENNPHRKPSYDFSPGIQLAVFVGAEVISWLTISRRASRIARIYTAKVIPSLENIDWHNFLHRPPLLPEYSEQTVSVLVRHGVLITGAGGSIGSALAMRLAAQGAKVVLLESSEGSLFDLQREFAAAGLNHSAVFFLGSAADRALLNEIVDLHQPRTVFHAAAFKHVPLLEEQPLAAIGNNVLGTDALVAVASARHARLILLSTDKAVAPGSVLGATKRIAEQLVLASGGTVVRLGNVLASRGSVAEVFAGQIAAGKALTVTDPAAHRFFLTLTEAVDLLVAASDAVGPKLFVPGLRNADSIADLARFVAITLAPDREVLIEFTGLRAGDKLAEELWAASETIHEDCGSLLHVDSPIPARRELMIEVDKLRGAVQSRDLLAALSSLRALVPDYTPSETLLAAIPVHHE